MRNEETLPHVVEPIALKRVGQPKEVVGAVLYFASAASSYSNGSCLAVDGGVRPWTDYCSTVDFYLWRCKCLGLQHKSVSFDTELYLDSNAIGATVTATGEHVSKLTA